MYKGDGDFLLKWDPEKTKELYFSLVIHTHTHIYIFTHTFFFKEVGGGGARGSRGQVGRES